MVGAALLAALAGVGDRSDDDAAAPSPTTASARPTADGGPVSDDRQLAARLLPDLARMGAGWVELNREPEGPDDPTLPTAPAISGECGGRRSVDETAAAFALYERRRGVDLDEQAIVYGLVFASDDDAAGQAALYRSDRFESCLRESFVSFYPELELAVVAEDRPLPELDPAVDGSGRVVRATASFEGFDYEGRTEVTVLRSDRRVVLVLREVAIGAPDPFPVDAMLRDVAARLADPER